MTMELAEASGQSSPGVTAAAIRGRVRQTLARTPRGKSRTACDEMFFDFDSTSRAA